MLYVGDKEWKGRDSSLVAENEKSRYCTSFKNASALTKRFGLTALHKQQIVTTVFGVVATLKDPLSFFQAEIELKLAFRSYSQRHIFYTPTSVELRVSQTIKHKQNFTIKLRFILAVVEEWILFGNQTSTGHKHSVSDNFDYVWSGP